MKLHSLAALAAILLMSAAQAAPGEDLLAGLGKCAALGDDKARLACYDQLAAEAKAAPVQPAPQAAVAPVKKDEESWFGLGVGDWFGGGTPPAAQKTPQQFGSESLPPPPAAPGAPPPQKALDSITATVTDFAYNPYGHFTVFLDNGQIWQQLQGDSGEAHFSKSTKDQVTISRGALGSYDLTIGDHARMFKVKRIK